MTIIPCAEWAPDMPDLSDFTDVLTNAIPRTPESYGPASGLAAFSDNALDSTCIGMFGCEDVSGNVYAFAGTASKLYIIGFLPANGLVNDGGVLTLFPNTGYPTDSSGAAGSLWSNGGVVSVVEPTTPNPLAAPVYFGSISASGLLALGGANLPITQPAKGSQQLWNNGGEVWVA